MEFFPLLFLSSSCLEPNSLLSRSDFFGSFTDDFLEDFLFDCSATDLLLLGLGLAIESLFFLLPSRLKSLSSRSSRDLLYLNDLLEPP